MNFKLFLMFTVAGLTSLLYCKDSTDNKIPLKPYSEKENKRNSCTLILKCTLKYPYTAPTNIRTLKYSPMCYKLSVFSIVELFLYTFVVSRAFMAGAASQAGDADSSRAPGLTSGLQGSVNVHRGALLLVPQWQCISSFVFYIFVTLVPFAVWSW